MEGPTYPLEKSKMHARHPRTELYKTLQGFLKQCQDRRALLRERYNWARQARDSQKEPSGDWLGWLILAGRGFGKTRTGAETVRAWIESGRAKRVCLLAHTLDEGRAVMVEGNSGLLSVCPPWNRPIFKADQNQLVWPSGAIATLYSALSYEKLRGPQFDGAWVDELAKFPSPSAAWDQLMMGLRLGKSPRVIVTTTPRPIPLIEQFLEDERFVATRGSTFENKKNLSQTYLQTMQKSYAGTDLGAQELSGEIVKRAATALWTPEMLENALMKTGDPLPEFRRVVVAVDPSVSENAEGADETGIIAAGIDAEGTAYVLDDLSLRQSPSEWAKVAIRAYHEHKADCLVAEVNNGGDLVRQLVLGISPLVCFKPLRAARGKFLRAQPVAALYRMGRVRHVPGLRRLEDQMLSYTADGFVPSPHQKTQSKSPDRLDALVWALFELCLSGPNENKNTQESSAPFIGVL